MSKKRITDQDVARFWPKVDIRGVDDCWNWMGSRSAKGYGFFRARGKTVTSHRFVWEIACGEEPSGHLLHSCDNPSCVNVRHLREGTNADNVRDRMERGRPTARPGSLNGRAKLNESGAKEIKDMLRRGVDRGVIAGRMGVSRSTVNHIATGRKWAHV